MTNRKILLIEENDDFYFFVKEGMLSLFSFDTFHWNPNKASINEGLVSQKYSIVMVSYRLLISEKREQIIETLKTLSKDKIFLIVSPIFDLEQALNSVNSIRPNYAFVKPVKNAEFNEDILRKIFSESEKNHNLIKTNRDVSSKLMSFSYKIDHRPTLIAIGSSTGGPQALLRYLSELDPLKLDVPIFITQHMPEKFTEIMANQITKSTKIPTFEGQHKLKVQKGCAYIAPGGKHMLIKKKDGQLLIELDDGPQENFCKPSVDPMLRSISSLSNYAIVTILTGMGRDGLQGVQEIKKNKSGYIMAQNEESSVVWGMPGAICKSDLQDITGTPSELGKLTYNILRGIK